MPLPDEAVTLGEVFRGVQALGLDLKDIKKHLDNRPTWADINRLEAARDLAAKLQDDAIKALEDTNTWLARTLFGTLATSVAGIIGVALNAANAAG